MKQTPKSWMRYCSEDLSKIEGYNRWLNDESDTVWDCHHRLEIELNMTCQELKDENMYYGRPASELIILTHGEHSTLHITGNTYMLGKQHSEETKLKMSKTKKGHCVTEETRLKLSKAHKGKTLSDEHKMKIGESLKDHTVSDETCRKISEAKKGKTNMLGKTWWNNGVICKRSKTCPGPDFVPGRLRHKHNI